MDDVLEKQVQESEEEWAEIEKTIKIREQKDKDIISHFCANNYADIARTLELLKKHKGMPKHDQERVNTFDKHYPDNITLKDILGYLDVKDIYRQFLESGGENND